MFQVNVVTNRLLYNFYFVHFFDKSTSCKTEIILSFLTTVKYEAATV